MTMISLILQYASSHGNTSFSRKELMSWLKGETGRKDYTQSALGKNLQLLVSDGRLNRTGHGTYAFPSNGKPSFSVRTDEDAKKIYAFVKERFPYTERCVWNPSCLVPFMVHIPNLDMYIVEIEKMAMSPLFSDLAEFIKDRRILLNPTEEEYIRYGSGHPLIIIKPLISQGPLTREGGIRVPTLEKILVDIVAGGPGLTFAGSSELYNIYAGVLRKYDINYKSLHRYARRRSIDEKVTEIIDQTINDSE